MRETIIAGNWKMNKQLDTAVSFVGELMSKAKESTNVKMVIAAAFPFLAPMKETIGEGSKIGLASQNIYPKDHGAYTGEVSAPMLISCGTEFVIVGHSERREYFMEDNAFVNEKVIYTLRSGLRPILCVGEPLNIREKSGQIDFVLEQLDSCLKSVDQNRIPQLIIAYEPIWAIGTGKTAKPEEAQSMHASIREYLTSEFKEAGNMIPVLYGGSMKPENAASLLSCRDIDGGLIGGASLETSSFLSIYDIARAHRS